jgi:quinol monooxygenase YgiN
VKKYFSEMECSGMSDEVHINVSLTIHEGKLNEFQAIAREMVKATQQEPGTRRYEWYLSSDGTSCQLIETYLDSDALLAHFNGWAVKEGVPKMLKTADVNGFEVYGNPGPQAREILSDFGAEIFLYWHGLDRRQ